jgi:hypothetical protein
MARDDIGLTIPTRGDHPDLLAGIIAASGLPAERIVIVATTPGVEVEGATVVEDLGPVNIHRWWNTGIDALTALGASHIAVLNDDLVITPGLLDVLSHALDVTDATIAVPKSRMTGWCWMLDTDHGIRPDEGYRWWFGDNDLFERANEAHGIAAVEGWPVHHPHANEATSRSPELQALAREDEARWHARRTT